ncbi:MAG: hypothetical protein ACOC33_00515 [bacterium]
MKPILIELKKPWLGRFAGIAIFPFVFYYKGDKTQEKINIDLNHETIHFHQAIEMLVIPFYLVYLISFLYNFFKYYLTTSYMDAYRRIPFEVEAYTNQEDLDYLKKRKFWAWVNYFNVKKG